MMVSQGLGQDWSGGAAPVPVQRMNLLDTVRAVQRRRATQTPARTTRTPSPATRPTQTQPIDYRSRSMRRTHSTPGRSQTVTVNVAPPSRAVTKPAITEDTISKIAERIHSFQRAATPVTTFTKTTTDPDKGKNNLLIVGLIVLAGAIFLRKV